MSPPGLKRAKQQECTLKTEYCDMKISTATSKRESAEKIIKVNRRNLIDYN